MIDDDIVAGLPIGTTTRSPGRTIGEGEFSLLNTLTWSIGELHTNQASMAESPFEERLLAGPILIAVVAGLHSVSDGYQMLKDEHGIKPLAALGISARFRKPLRPDDTIYVDTEIMSARPSSSRSGVGVLVLKDVAINQDGDVVIEVERPLLFERVTSVPAVDE